MTQEIILEEREYYDLNNTKIKYTRDIQYDNYNDIFYLRNFYLKEFENNEFFKDSIKLRKFDEIAKKAGLNIKSINEYKNLLISKLI